MRESRSVIAEQSAGPRISPVYRMVMAAAWPIVRWWGRLEVVGAHQLPTEGATIVVANHDSAWDPVVIAAAVRRRRQIHALAKASLWEHPLLGRVLDGMGQIPVERGRADAAAMAAAGQHLAAGGCVGIFPEGTVSRGRHLRARSGAGRLARAVPQARIVCAAVTGTVDITRFPRRPRLRVTFFDPALPAATESAQELSTRLTAEIRRRAPVVESVRP
ncbi:lysophospholipid acyltransferase family protein [Actinoplanes sp. NPDC049599]|uniref:lysophospholipid acyltransferase family protein n=1 Tax=Actinoplanes sp. NPDC049599 TaxID=3363903 RepID=UPI0037886852